MLVKVQVFPLIIIMVSGGGLANFYIFSWVMLVFLTDDSAWLQEAPLDIEVLPV